MNFHEPEHWIVRAEYVFIDGGPSVDTVDDLVDGELLPGSGGVHHAVGNQPFQTTLEWRVATLDSARLAVERLGQTHVVKNVAVTKLRRDRVLASEEFCIRRTDALAGRAVCVACGARIRATHDAEFALEGATAGNEITLRCQTCGFPISWLIMPE